MADRKKRGRPSVGLGETQLFVRCTPAMKRQLERLAAKRSKAGSPINVSTLVRDLLVKALAEESAS